MGTNRDFMILVGEKVMVKEQVETKRLPFN